MGLHICNECDLKLECDYAFTSELELWCKHPSPIIRDNQNKKFDEAHKDDWGY